MCDHCRPLAEVVDLEQRGLTLAVDAEDLVTDVVLLVKAITPTGHPYVVQGCSAGTDWITEHAMLSIAANGVGRQSVQVMDEE